MNAGEMVALQKAAEIYGTPSYVYRLGTIDEQIQTLRMAFGGRFEVSYAMKANPNKMILELFRERVEILDVSSVGEISKALLAGWEPSKMTFTGPGKRENELEQAVGLGVGGIVVESIEEAEALDRIAKNYGRQQRILIRFAPDRVPSGFGVKMAGRPTQFGIDEGQSSEAVQKCIALPNVELIGFHAFSGTQCLDATALIENYKIYVDMFIRIAKQEGVAIQRCILGSGLGIPYHDGDAPVDLNAVAAEVNPYIDGARKEEVFKSTVLTLETGRFLVGEAGFFLTSVIGTKISRGMHLAVCDGGMNNHLGACGLLGTVIRRNYPIELLAEHIDSRPVVLQHLVGPLCTSIDLLGQNVELPLLQAGDVVAVRCSGAYGLSASPVNFISHPVPREILWADDAVPPLSDISQSLGGVEGTVYET